MRDETTDPPSTGRERLRYPADPDPAGAVTTTLPQIDVNIPRFNQAWVALLMAAAFVLQWWPLVAITAAIVGLSRFGGPRLAPFTQLYVRFLRPRLGRALETEWAAPPRFSQLLAAIFLGAATALFVAGFSAAAWALTLMVTALATLSAAARICVGCVIYRRIAGRVDG